MTSEEAGIRILEAPPPSEETGYELVYTYGGQRRTWKANKKPPEERLGFLEIITTPGLNIIFLSLIGGIAILAYVLYMYFRLG